MNYIVIILYFGFLASLLTQQLKLDIAVVVISLITLSLFFSVPGQDYKAYIDNFYFSSFEPYNHLIFEWLYQKIVWVSYQTVSFDDYRYILNAIVINIYVLMFYRGNINIGLYLSISLLVVLYFGLDRQIIATMLVFMLSFLRLNMAQMLLLALLAFSVHRPSILFSLIYISSYYYYFKILNIKKVVAVLLFFIMLGMFLTPDNIFEHYSSYLRFSEGFNFNISIGKIRKITEIILLLLVFRALFKRRYFSKDIEHKIKLFFPLLLTGLFVSMLEVVFPRLLRLEVYLVYIPIVVILSTVPNMSKNFSLAISSYYTLLLLYKLEYGQFSDLLTNYQLNWVGTTIFNY
jgi:hypothetical protein